MINIFDLLSYKHLHYTQMKLLKLVRTPLNNLLRGF